MGGGGDLETLKASLGRWDENSESGSCSAARDKKVPSYLFVGPERRWND